MANLTHVWTVSRIAALLGLLLLALAPGSIVPGSIGGANPDGHGGLYLHATEGHDMRPAAAASGKVRQADCDGQESTPQLHHGSACCVVAGCHLGPVGALADGQSQGIWPPVVLLFSALGASVPVGIGALPLVPPPRRDA